MSAYLDIDLTGVAFADLDKPKARTYQWVTPGNPCPICGKGDYCSIAVDGDRAKCRRYSESANGPGDEYEDALGPYWFYRLDQHGEHKPRQAPEKITPRGKRASDDTCHEIYTLLFQFLPLRDKHREKLRARGISDDGITAGNYRSLEGWYERKKAVAKFVAALRQKARDKFIREAEKRRAKYEKCLVNLASERSDTQGGWATQETIEKAEKAEKAYRKYWDDYDKLLEEAAAKADEILWRVPGFVQDRDGEWTLYGANGYLIPYYDRTGGITAVQIRKDTWTKKKGKYSWLSDPKGAPSGAPAHLPLGVGRYLRLYSVEDLWVTEGGQKANVCTELLRAPVVGMPSATGHKAALEAVRGFDYRCAVLGQDADALRKPHVAIGLKNAYNGFLAEGKIVKVAVWDESLGKGLDDLLKNGYKPTVLVGDEARAEVERIVAAAEARQPYKPSRAATTVEATVIAATPATLAHTIADDDKPTVVAVAPEPEPKATATPPTSDLDRWKADRQLRKELADLEEADLFPVTPETAHDRKRRKREARRAAARLRLDKWRTRRSAKYKATCEEQRKAWLAEHLLPDFEECERAKGCGASSVGLRHKRANAVGCVRTNCGRLICERCRTAKFEMELRNFDHHMRKIKPDETLVIRCFRQENTKAAHRAFERAKYRAKWFYDFAYTLPDQDWTGILEAMVIRAGGEIPPNSRVVFREDYDALRRLVYKVVAAIPTHSARITLDGGLDMTIHGITPVELHAAVESGKLDFRPVKPIRRSENITPVKDAFGRKNRKVSADDRVQHILDKIADAEDSLTTKYLALATLPTTADIRALTAAGAIGGINLLDPNTGLELALMQAHGGIAETATELLERLGARWVSAAYVTERILELVPTAENVAKVRTERIISLVAAGYTTEEAMAIADHQLGVEREYTAEELLVIAGHLSDDAPRQVIHRTWGEWYIKRATRWERIGFWGPNGCAILREVAAEHGLTTKTPTVLPLQMADRVTVPTGSRELTDEIIAKCIERVERSTSTPSAIASAA